jgi:hypothetical protein
LSMVDVTSVGITFPSAHFLNNFAVHSSAHS